MRGCFTLMAAAMLLPLSVSAGRADVPSEAVQSCPVCTELLEQAQQIDRILRSVSDRESADKAADELKKLFDRMQSLCGQLEKLPVSTPEAARMLSDSMRTLTHIFQSYIPVVERLMEVNAYGSEKLVNVFNLYKVREGYVAERPQEDSTEVLIRQEWSEALEEILYLVRKLNSSEEIRLRLEQIEQKVKKVELCRQSALSAEPMTSREMSERSRVQLDSLHRELSAERSRLHAAGLLTKELEDLLNRCHP
ncbi:MAG: hypothetical protein IJ498_09630 [Akkermansia sp.]|nr:hypothetical protein [Akkermansia sp.]